MDVKSAFLNGVLNTEIYMKPPQGFIAARQDNKVCQLKMAIYSLKQASLLHTRPLPLGPQDNEELVRLLWEADTGNLLLLDMTLNLELFLMLAIDRWTACVTHQPYALGSGMVSPFHCFKCPNVCE